MDRPIAYRGGCLRVVYAVLKDGTSPGLDFYNEQSPKDKAKLQSLFVWLGDHGWINNDTRFKPIEGTEFFEFKAFQIRMPCYRSGNLMIITHGFKKKRDAIDPTEIKRARRIKGEDQMAVVKPKARGAF